MSDELNVESVQQAAEADAQQEAETQVAEALGNDAAEPAAEPTPTTALDQGPVDAAAAPAEVGNGQDGPTEASSLSDPVPAESVSDGGSPDAVDTEHGKVIFTLHNAEIKAVLADRPEVCGYGPTREDALKALAKQPQLLG